MGVIDQAQKDALYHSIAKDIAETLSRKNHDYGDSFHEVYSKYGDISTFIRLSDKLNRYETLLTKSAKVDESIEDVLRDMAGYCILTLASKQRLK